MMSKLTQLRDEATRLLTVYVEHRDSEDPDMRRRAHVELDKFLMQHRETAALLMVQGLNEEILRLADKRHVETTRRRQKPWFFRRLRRRNVTTNT